MTSNAIHGVSFRMAGLRAGKYSLFCIQQIYFVMSDGPCFSIQILVIVMLDLANITSIGK